MKKELMTKELKKKNNSQIFHSNLVAKHSLQQIKILFLWLLCQLSGV